MPEMRQEVEMAPGQRDLVRFPWISKLLYTVAAIAVSVLNTGGTEVSTQVQGSAQGLPHEGFSNFDPAAGNAAAFNFADVLSGRGPWDDSGRTADDAPRPPGQHGLLRLADLQRLTQNSETASQLLSQGELPVEWEDEEDHYDWDTVEESLES